MRDARILAIGVLLVVLLAVTAYQNQRRFHRPLLTTEYQRVTLQNGAIYYGRIDHLGSDNPVLRDVMAVHEEQLAGSSETRYVVTARRDEAHGADHMILPATSIISVEPVGPDSTIGRLIAGAQRRR